MNELYLYLSVIVGLAIIVDSRELIKNIGIAGKSNIQSVTTTIEFSWALVSMVALIDFEFDRYEIMVPAVYLMHNVFGWVYGYLMVVKNPKICKGEEQLIIPKWHVYFGYIFGALFSLLSLGFALT